MRLLEWELGGLLSSGGGADLNVHCDGAWGGDTHGVLAALHGEARRVMLPCWLPLLCSA